MKEGSAAILAGVDDILRKRREAFDEKMKKVDEKIKTEGKAQRDLTRALLETMMRGEDVGDILSQLKDMYGIKEDTEPDQKKKEDESGER